jgi:hypothetical protein
MMCIFHATTLKSIIVWREDVKELNKTTECRKSNTRSGMTETKKLLQRPLKSLMAPPPPPYSVRPCATAKRVPDGNRDRILGKETHFRTHELKEFS